MTALVQASIAVIGFPGTLGELDHFLYVDEASGEVIDSTTDLDDLLLGAERSVDESLTWTAPRWITQGDLLFFYHAKSARRKIDRLLKEIDEISEVLGLRTRSIERDRDKQDLRTMTEAVRLLEHAAELSDRYSGSILACAEVSAPSEYLHLKGDLHYSSRSFAPLGRVHLFEHPLSADDLKQFVKIGQGTANTPLYERQFEGIKRKLAACNTLPDFLENARIGGETFRDVNRDNWPGISCSASARYVNEEQLRAYLLDFLLEELKDARTPLLRECRCVRGGKETGFADYFVKVNGGWIPVEAKLNSLSMPEKKLLEQVARYVGIDTFYPTIGSNRGEKYEASSSPLCLLADQSGIFLVSNGKFRGCSFGEPAWRREDLEHSTVAVIREKIKEQGRSR